MSTCLIVVDVQNDFCPGGALAVPKGNEVVPMINRLTARVENVVLTQDWTEKAQLVVRKGFHRDIDSYSGFLEADRETTTGLAGFLKEKGFQALFVCGLATDFCVAWTALDARATGFEVSVVEDACRAIDLEGSLARAWDDMRAAGVEHTTSQALLLRTRT